MAENDGQNGQLYIEARLRDVERASATVSVSLSNMSSDIIELKSMFSKFLIDSRKISELETKVNDIGKLGEKTDALFRKYDNLNLEFQSVKSEHNTCQLTKTKSEKLMQDLHDRMVKIELAVTTLTISKGRIDSTLIEWVNKLGFAAIIGILILLATHWKDISSADISPQSLQNKSEYQEQYDLEHEQRELYESLRKKYGVTVK